MSSPPKADKDEEEEDPLATVDGSEDSDGDQGTETEGPTGTETEGPTQEDWSANKVAYVCVLHTTFPPLFLFFYSFP